ncbi:hypothetical protein BDW60DRAFT_198920 [Aspergillus nidulans var. acristatus]|jgi:hypothetical protein
MSSLSQSRWAPASAANPKPFDRGSLLSPSEELARFLKIVARLKWKLPFLDEGYRRATATATATVQDPAIDAQEIAQAEIMFKLDFHEYYALLERALVHLLGVFGVTVSAKNNYTGWAASHRYHANVLDALQARDSPLRSVLGTGETFKQLKRAKELRNRWKTADLSAEEKVRDDFYSAMRGEEAKPLDSYDLRTILTAVFEGLDQGYRLAETYAAQHDTSQNGRGLSGQGQASNDWDFIVDAMDWESV